MYTWKLWALLLVAVQIRSVEGFGTNGSASADEEMNTISDRTYDVGSSAVHWSWLPTVHWEAFHMFTSIEGNYDERCDMSSPNFKMNNADELNKLDNFKLVPATFVGVLTAMWDAMTVILAWYTVPELPLPSVDNWIGDRDPVHGFEGLRDPVQGLAGPTLAQVVVPPSISRVTANYMSYKMKDPAFIGPIRMPWSLKVQVLVFLGQAAQAVISTWSELVLGPASLWWTITHFQLTFRFELWAKQVLIILRLLMTYKALQRFIGIDIIGIDVTSALLIDSSWSWLAYPWQSSGSQSAKRAIFAIDTVSKRVVLPTAAIVAFIFSLGIVFNLVPGIVLGTGLVFMWKYGMDWYYNRSLETTDSGSLEQGLLSTQSVSPMTQAFSPSDTEEFVPKKSEFWPTPERPQELMFIGLFSMLTGYFISAHLKSLLTPDTYLCPYAKMVFMNLDFTKSRTFASIVGYAGVIITTIMIAYTCVLLKNVFDNCVKDPIVEERARTRSGSDAAETEELAMTHVQSDAYKVSGTLKDSSGADANVGYIGELFHGLWADRSFKELNDDIKDELQRLSFSAICDPQRTGKDFKAPRPGRRDVKKLKEWLKNLPSHWTNCKVGAIMCLRAADCSALELKKNCDSSAEHLKMAGFSMQELHTAEFSIQVLRNVGYTAEDLHKFCEVSIDKLKAGGYSAKEIRKAGYDIAALKREGFSAVQVFDAGYSAKDAEEAGYTPAEIAVQEVVDYGWNTEFLQNMSVKLTEAGWRMKDLEPYLENMITLMLSHRASQDGSRLVPTGGEPSSPMMNSSANSQTPAALPAVRAPMDASRPVPIPQSGCGPSSPAMDSSANSETPDASSTPCSPSVVAVEPLTSLQPTFEVDMIVEAHSLTREDMNGGVGRVVKLNVGKAKDRILVEFVELGKNALNPRNLRMASEAKIAEREREIEKKQERERLRRETVCQIRETALSSGVAPCPGGPRQECPQCKKFFCTYHHRIHNQDGLGKFGGHVCQPCKPTTQAASGDAAPLINGPDTPAINPGGTAAADASDEDDIYA